EEGAYFRVQFDDDAGRDGRSADSDVGTRNWGRLRQGFWSVLQPGIYRARECDQWIAGAGPGVDWGIGPGERGGAGAALQEIQSQFASDSADVDRERGVHQNFGEQLHHDEDQFYEPVADDRGAISEGEHSRDPG